MNVLIKYAVMGLAGLLAACTATLEDLPGTEGTGNTGITSDDRRSMDMQIRNELLTGTTSTRADGSIALPAENEVTAMDIYVFGSETEHGIYTFQERLTYRAGQEEVAPEGATPFVLVTNGTDNKLSTARLSLKKGLYVKLYCVANAPQLYVLDGDAQKYVPAQFNPLTMEKVDGDMKIVASGTPSEKDFLTNCTAHCLDSGNPEDVIRTPLLMRGNVTGCVNLTDCNDNSRIQTSIKLMRGVARFDVHNVAQDSRLTITGIGMSDGNATTALFPFDARPAPDGSLITYPWRYFTGGVTDPINQGTQLGAFYSYAAPAKACLLLQGDFKTAGGEVIPVNYRVPFNSLTDGEGNQIAIQPNHRYTVTVNEADPYEVKLTITVADWEEGGSVDDFHPDGEQAGGMSELTTAAVTNVNDSYVYDNKSYIWVATYANTARDKFTVKLSSNAAIDCKMKFGDGDKVHQWLDMRCTETKAPNGAAWSTDYTYTFSVNNQTIDGSNTDKAFPSVLISFTSAGGIVRTVRVESLTYSLDGKSMANASSYNNDGEYWYFNNGSGTWAQAMEACQEEQGWYLPTMNDYRNLFRVDNWNTVELPFASTPYENLFDQTNERSVSNTYLQQFYTGYSYPGYPYQACSESYYGESKYNYYGSNYDYFWSADSYDANTARSIQLRAQTYAYERCSRKKVYYGSNNQYWYYDYYQSNGRGLNSSYVTYQKTTKTASRKIRCVKRRPGNLVYPY